jgi:hypothetical protein
MSLWFSSLTRPLSAATRLLPAAALALSVMGGGPAEAATGPLATSTGGDLSLLLGTTSVNPVAVGQNVIVGLNITNRALSGGSRGERSGPPGRRRHLFPTGLRSALNRRAALFRFRGHGLERGPDRLDPESSSPSGMRFGTWGLSRMP